MTKEKIARINELAHKSKTVGLTEAEKTEQQAHQALVPQDSVELIHMFHGNVWIA